MSKPLLLSIKGSYADRKINYGNLETERKQRTTKHTQSSSEHLSAALGAVLTHPHCSIPVNCSHHQHTQMPERLVWYAEWIVAYDVCLVALV